MSLKKNSSSFHFALFASFLCGIYKSVLCIMRRICKDDRINASIAGAFSAVSILLDAKKQRTFMALMFFSRCIVSHCNLKAKGYCDHNA